MTNTLPDIGKYALLMSSLFGGPYSAQLFSFIKNAVSRTRTRLVNEHLEGRDKIFSGKKLCQLWIKA
jgi:hypothetical protein